MPSIEDIQDALDRPVGKRAIHQRLRTQLDAVNNGQFIRATAGNYLHCGRGGYAVVYHVKTQKGTEIALRCLINSLPNDVGERCNALHDFLRAQRPSLSYFVQHRLYTEALLIDGTYQPVFVMDWVEGENLITVVDRLVGMGDVRSLSILATNVQAMVVHMQSVGLAHGDLQHDNIMVLPSMELRLVDYDSVYVPSLAGRTCPIAGLKGYSHPDYLSGDAVRPFNDKMDTFAALVIVLSLRALAIDCSLFRLFSVDNLLLSEDDLIDLDRSKTMRFVRALGDRQVTAIANQLIAMCRERRLAEVFLETVIGDETHRRKPPGPRIIIPTIPQPPPIWSRRESLSFNQLDRMVEEVDN